MCVCVCVYVCVCACAYISSLSTVVPSHTCLLIGVDQGEPCTGSCTEGQPTPAAVRGEAGEDVEVLHPGEGPVHRGPGHHLGLPRRQA